MFQQGAALALVQAHQRRQVHAAVAILGVKPGDRLGGVVGAHHQQVPLPGQSILQGHALPGLEVAAHEVAQRLSQRFLNAAGRHVGGRADVERHHFRCLNKAQGQLRVSLVGLDVVGQPGSHEGVTLASFGTKFRDGQRTQPSGEAGVLAARNTQHEAACRRAQQVRFQEIHAAAHLGRRVDVGPHAQFGDDAGLESGHARWLTFQCLILQHLISQCLISQYLSHVSSLPRTWKHTVARSRFKMEPR